MEDFKMFLFGNFSSRNNFNALGDFVVFVEAFVYSVPAKLVWLCYQDFFFLASLPELEHLHPQETFLFNIVYGKEHTHSDFFFYF